MGRRSKGEGSVYRRKNGYWVAQLNGTYKYAKTEREAKKKLLELLRNSDQQQKPSQLTVSELMEQWLDFTRGRVKESTAALYQEHIDRYINPVLGAKKLTAVDALGVQAMYSRMLSSGLSPATVKLTHSVMSSSFKRAVKWGLLSINPISNVDAPRIAHKEVEVFDPSEVQALLSAASEDRLEALYVLMLSTGMRIGELLALQWPDIDLDRGTLSVRHTVNPNNGTLDTPKSKNSRRTIKLPRKAIEALRHHPRTTSSTHVFTNDKGTAIKYKRWHEKDWAQLIKRAGIPYRNPHMCRHYVASELLGQGVPVTAVARYIGDTETTLLNTYSHLIKGMEHMVPDAMDDVLG